MSRAALSRSGLATLLLAAGCTTDGTGPRPGASPDAGAADAPILSESSQPMPDPTPVEPPPEAESSTAAETTPETTPETNAGTTPIPASGNASERRARAPSGPAPDTLLTSLRVDEPRSAADAPLWLYVETTNATSADVDLLLWNTPFEPILSADSFRVSRDGEPVEYQGRMVKRALPPRDDAIVRLAPGETLQHGLNLARHYALDAPGTYTIEFVPAPVPVDDGSAATARFASLLAADEDPIVVERR